MGRENMGRESMEGQASRMSIAPAPDRGSALLIPQRLGSLGPVELLRGTAGAFPAPDLPERGGRGAACYGIWLQRRGTSSLRHYGLGSTLGEGDVVLVNEAAAHETALGEGGELVILRVPVRLLRTYLPSPEQYCGRPLRSGEGITASVADLIADLCARVADAQPEPFGDRIARNLLDLLATAFALVHDGALAGSPVICDRNARVRLHIEANLRDPELRPSAIAASLRLSPRYLRAILAAGKETVSAYILRRRLEECARELRDPALRHRSITDIAFGWGFNSGPHFARSFRGHFGMSPRDFRRLGSVPD